MNGKTIINICSTRYLFKQSPGSVDEVVDFFNLSEGTKNFLTAATPGQCVISLNNTVTAIKFIITKYEETFVFT
jgi:conjugal transfer ATP-binding protein TraC